MSRSQRNRRRRRGRGRPRNKALLALMVVLVLVGLAGLSAVGYVVSIAASAPPLSSLKPRDSGSQSEVRAADGTRLGFIQSNELRRPAEGNRSPRRSRTPRSRSRTALLPAQGRRLRGHRPRRACKNLVQPEDGAGRLDDHDAARPQPLHHARADLPAQDPRGQARRGARERALQGVDPRQVPQHGAVRDARRPVGDRRQGRRARVLQQVGRASSSCARPRCSPACRRRRRMYSPLRAPGSAKARRNEVLAKMAEPG